MTVTCLSKTCFKCGVHQPLTEFYKHGKMADGHLNKCKTCTKLDVRTHRAENDSVREYDRSRGYRQSAERVAEYRRKYPRKYSAHNWVNNAVRDGRIIKASNCEVCSSDFHIEGHHDDYSKKEVVRWLCSRCHSLWHAEHGEALNP